MMVSSLFLLSLILLGYTIQHEQVHVDIFKRHGCTESTWGLSWQGGWALCSAYQERSEATRLNEHALHVQLDTSAYSTMTIVLGVYLMGVMTLARAKHS